MNKPKVFSDFFALSMTKFFRLIADTFFAKRYGHRAVVLETIADEQMRNFRNNPANKGRTMKFKLWKYSRHPNYLGELLFWFGICLIGINSDAAPILIILCPIPMMMLFIFVSCPLMDERSLKNRSDYQEYMEKTSQLLLLPPKE